jgi:DNA-directed RNA polymerase specialized sigma24 family protein
MTASAHEAMVEETLEEIGRKLDRVVLLLAMNSIKDLKPNDAIVLLGEVGLERNQIARLVGTTAGTVSVRLSESKAKRKPSTEKKKRPKKK